MAARTVNISFSRRSDKSHHKYIVGEPRSLSVSITGTAPVWVWIVLISGCAADTSAVADLRPTSEEFADLFCNCFDGMGLHSVEECILFYRGNDASWACQIPIYADWEERCPGVVVANDYNRIRYIRACLLERGCDEECLEVPRLDLDFQPCIDEEGFSLDDYHEDLRACPDRLP